MSNQIIDEVSHKVARVGAAMIGVFHHADGRLETIAVGNMNTSELDDTARELSFVVRALRRHANALGMKRQYNFSASSFLSGESATAPRFEYWF